jgi:hypothetical protein
MLLLNPVPSLLDGMINHHLDAITVNGEECITDPVLVQMHPVSLLWQVLQVVRFVLGIVQEVL